jgi:hypothetical protein
LEWSGSNDNRFDRSSLRSVIPAAAPAGQGIKHITSKETAQMPEKYDVKPGQSIELL